MVTGQRGPPFPSKTEPATRILLPALWTFAKFQLLRSFMRWSRSISDAIAPDSYQLSPISGVGNPGAVILDASPTLSSTRPVDLFLNNSHLRWLISIPQPSPWSETQPLSSGPYNSFWRGVPKSILVPLCSFLLAAFCFFLFPRTNPFNRSWNKALVFSTAYGRCPGWLTDWVPLPVCALDTLAYSPPPLHSRLSVSFPLPNSHPTKLIPDNTSSFPSKGRVKVRLGRTHATTTPWQTSLPVKSLNVACHPRQHSVPRSHCRWIRLVVLCLFPAFVLGPNYSSNLQHPEFSILLKELALLPHKSAFTHLNQICITI